MTLDVVSTEIDELTAEEREQYEKIAMVPYTPPADEVVKALRQSFVGEDGSLYREEYADQAARLCGTMGATDRQLAAFFGVTEMTILNWASRYPAFRDARKNGKSFWDDKVEGALLKRAMGYDKVTKRVQVNRDGSVAEFEETTHYPGDVKAQFIWLRNRRPDEWADRREIVDPTRGKDEDRPTRPVFEIAQRIAFLMNQASDQIDQQPGIMKVIERKVTISE